MPIAVKQPINHHSSATNGPSQEAEPLLASCVSKGTPEAAEIVMAAVLGLVGMSCILTTFWQP
jgi:hypothetical protein